MLIDNNNRKNSEILDEIMIDFPKEKYLFGDYPLDELLKICGFWSSFLLAYFSIKPLIFVFGLFFIIFSLNDIFEKKKNHWRWKLWVILFSLANISVLNLFPNWL